MVQFYKAPKKQDKANPSKNNTYKSNAKKETIHIDSIDHSGNGLALSTKPITIIENALPQEDCEIQITSTNKKVRFAKTIKVLKASEIRQEAFCKYYDKCGGCSFQHTSANKGLALKTNALQSFLNKHVGIPNEVWIPAIASGINNNAVNTNSGNGYRRRVRLAIDARRLSSASESKQTLLKIGYRQSQSKEIVDIDHCPIAEPEINRVIAMLKQALFKMPAINKVGHLVITRGDNLTQLAIFVVAELPAKSVKFLDKLALEYDIQIQVINKNGDTQICGNKRESLVANNLVYALPKNTETLQSTQKFELEKYMQMEIQASHFLQVNAHVNMRMITLAREWIIGFLQEQKQATHLYDFFCGSGNFTLALADLFESSVGIEGLEKMVSVAKNNAKLNDVKKCEFICLDLADSDCLKNIQLPNGAVVVLDPSREGAKLICEHLIHKHAALIVYVSCNPNSFSRDFTILSQVYELKAITALDMFPYTKHLEIMAMFAPK